MKASVFITLKQGVLDPQGKAIEGALGHLGFNNVSQVRQGKLIELEVNAGSEAEAKKQLEAMCEKLLANTVIENYKINIA